MRAMIVLCMQMSIKWLHKYSRPVSCVVFTIMSGQQGTTQDDDDEMSNLAHITI